MKRFAFQVLVGDAFFFCFKILHMRKTNDVKNNFSALLRDCLRSRYGKIPSAAVVAREFNLRAYDTTPISQESARRWIRGVSLPEEERLRILVEWLDLDFNEALRAKTSYPRFRPAGLSSSAGSQSVWSANGPMSGKESALVGRPNGQGNGFAGGSGNGHIGNGHIGGLLGTIDDEFLKLVLDLNDVQRKALTDLIKTSFQTGNGKSQ